MRVSRVVAVAALLSTLAVLPSAGAQTTIPPVRAVDVDLVSGGAWVTWSNGRVEARSLGGGSVVQPPRPTFPAFFGLGESAVALVPTGDGYWLFTSAGRVFMAGGVPFHGDLAGFNLNDPIVAAAPTASGGGYYMLGADGGVFTFGDAEFYGSVQGIVDEVIGAGARAADHLTAPIVTLATTPAGYWLVASDGAVFPFGDAPYHGSFQDILNTGNQLAGIQRNWTITPRRARGVQRARDALDKPIVDVVPSAGGAGYLMLAADGGIFNFGQSQFHGSAAGRTSSPAVGSDVTLSRDAYVIVTAGGTVHEFGSLRDSSTPGQGVTVRMARAGWSTGYFQAELYKLLLEELGYTVTDPAELQLEPRNAYVAMAFGNVDFWANSWYPNHYSWLADKLPDGTLVGDHVSPIGNQLVSGGLQGFVIEKKFADKYGIRTLDDLNRNAAALAEYDATDVRPGNGVADIYGCPESWTCDDIINSMIAFSGWANIAQFRYGYDAMFELAVRLAAINWPFVIYTWTPSAYITQLIPGQHVYWLGVENVLDDSNPLGIEDGEEYTQGEGTAQISAGRCPAAAIHRDGLCQLGWWSSDILVTASNDFMRANPAARRLFEEVELSFLDASWAIVAQDNGAAPKDLAAEWIADNRSTVDHWLAAARTAA